MNIELSLPWLRVWLKFLYVDEDWRFILFPVTIFDVGVMLRDDWHKRISISLEVESRPWLFQTFVFFLRRSWFWSNDEAVMADYGRIQGGG